MLLIIVLFLFILGLFIPIYINVEFKREKNESFFKISFILLKDLLKLTIDIPFIDLILEDKKLAVRFISMLERGKREKDIIAKEKKLIIEKVYKKLSKRLKIIRKNRHILNTINNYLSKKINISKFIWITRIGTNDAALTGLIVGVIWAIKSTIISFVLSNKKVESVNIEVIPVFSQEVFEIHFDCIIKIKMVYIIIAGYYGLKAKIKGGEVYV